MLEIKIEESEDFNNAIKVLSKEDIRDSFLWLYNEYDVWLGNTIEMKLNGVTIYGDGDKISV